MPAAPEPSEADQREIYLWAPFYLINYAIFAVICALHVTVYFRSRGKSRIDGHLVDLPAEGVAQRGYRRDYLGTGVKLLGILWLLWLEIALLLLVIGQYNGTWPFYSVDFEPTWNSFTRGFLGCLGHQYGCSDAPQEVQQLFQHAVSAAMRACHVRVGWCYVMMSAMAVDECGGVTRHSELCRVEGAVGASRWVTFQLRRYTWSGSRAVGPPAFEAVSIFDPRGPTARQVHGSVNGHDSSTASTMIKEAAAVEYFNYFYMYQLCAVWLTVYWDYVTYGLLLALLAIMSGLLKVYTERRQRFELRNMARVSGAVWVKRDGSWTRTTSDLLVQGDVIALLNDEDTRESAGLLSVDAMLVSGNAVVDESLLTGETMPIQKFQVPSPSADPGLADVPRSPETENKKHYVFAGTKLLSATGEPKEGLPAGSTGTGCLLVVTHTSAGDTAGQPPAYLVIWCTAEAGLGQGDPHRSGHSDCICLGSILTACFSIVGMINPLLSIAILGGQLAAASRLRSDKSKRFRLIGRSAKERDSQAAFTDCDDEGDIGGNLRVYCRDVERLTLTGRLSQMCFDKTGTLTKTGLDFVGIVRVDAEKPTAPPTLLSFSEGPPSKGVEGLIGPSLALTHTVSVVGANQRVGHQVELRMVEAAASLGWSYDMDMSVVQEPQGEGKWEVLKQHTFDHHSMTMSVVARNVDSGKVYVFCKGSHEAILSRCSFHNGEESAGSDTREVFEGLVVSAAERYAAEGCYVLAIAAREIAEGTSGRSAPRQELESELSLLGLLLFRNELKPDSSRHISCLKAGGIDSVMITGDSVLTGATVARKVGVIPRRDRVVIGGASAEGSEIEWRDMDSHEIVPESAVCGPGARPTSLCVTGACFAALLRSEKLVPLMGCRGECENSLLPAGVRRPGLVDCTCARIRVFGRMTPHQKVSVITAYSRPPLNLITGLALSGRVEASVAAPFSTDSPSIGSLLVDPSALPLPPIGSWS
ncbi:hypothetical protein FOZ60_006164 [Perkinsus olseni]|uniref:P-type ATPase A domain-containing protein n=1 Tax=Perkinsus olseni TaxID=32597 RepID=A0A7J6PGC2_PEROL|nr:hypothetical protein FOZ60_006164 [Perkinsus olseni]